MLNSKMLLVFLYDLYIRNESYIPKPTFPTFSMILNSRPDLPAVKPIIDAFCNKWYQRTQKSILHHIEQEKLQVIHISEIFFSNTPKSRVAQPNIQPNPMRCCRCYEVFPLSHCLSI